ncbi:MAG TPA: imidazolonepropionase [Sphingomicrobium sp.]|nr:imidazolonepropionase [Sphingomicrobium sp.]
MAEIGLIKNGAVYIRNGRVAAVGRRSSVRRMPGATRARTIEATDAVVLPGFVDSHTHALFVGTRVDEYVARLRGATYEEIAEAGGGIQASAARLRRASPSSLVEHLVRVAPLFFEYGTTTAEVKSGYGLDVRQELKMLEAIRHAARRTPFEFVPTVLCHDVPAALKTDRGRYVKQVMDWLLPTVAGRRLAEFCDVFCDRGYFTVAEAKRMLKAAGGAGLKLKLHAEQLAHTGAARMAAALNAVSVDHADHIGDVDMAALEKHGTIATLLPGSTFHLGDHRYAPARRLIERGIPVALATNFNPGSSPTLNMQMILSLACSQMRMMPSEAIVAATFNGAHAVGRADRLGSLERGKQADLVIMDVTDYREIPYFFAMNHCRMVIKNGRVVYARER